MKEKIIQKTNPTSNSLLVHKVNISHYRLIQLTSLADQEKPFYDWVERQAQQLFNTDKDLNNILQNQDERDCQIFCVNSSFSQIDFLIIYSK